MDIRTAVFVFSEILRDARRLDSKIERLLKMDLATSLRSLAIVDCLHELLRTGGRQITNAASLDQHSLTRLWDGSSSR